MFFLPVEGSNRATALASGVNEYNDTKSCEADGRDGRCSTISHTIRNTRRVLLAFRQYIRGLEVLFCSSSEGDGGDASLWWVELLCGMSLFSGTMMPLG